MALGHGSSRACYYGGRPRTGTCNACLKVNRARRGKFRAEHRDRERDRMIAYRATAAGMLSKIRSQAKVRLG